MGEKKSMKKVAAGNAISVDIGITATDREAIAAGLSRLLADTYTLYLKTHNFHWNVTGPMFQTLHLMFETQYNELALAVDLIAERIRALGFRAPGTYGEFAKLTLDQGRRRRAEGGRDDPHARGRSGDRGAHRALGVPGGRRSPRRADGRPAHPAHAGPREDGVDASKPARKVNQGSIFEKARGGLLGEG